MPVHDDPVKRMEAEARLGAALAALVRELTLEMPDEQLVRMVKLPTFMDALELLDELQVEWKKDP
jgi:hypothetical protein